MKLVPYVSAFKRFAASLPAGEREARARQLNAFIEAGFPTRRIEEWRYTDLSGLAEITFELAHKAAPNLSRLFLANTSLATFVNGEGTSSLESPPTPTLPDKEEGSVVYLNSAFARDGFSLNLAANQIAEKPFHILSWSESSAPTMSHLRHRIVLGANAQATVIFQHGGSGEYLTTQVTDIELGANSHLTLYRVQDEGARSHHLAQTHATLGRDSRLNLVSVDFGAGLVRHDLNVALAAAGAEVHAHGLYAPARGAHVDNHTRIEHQAPHCISREFFRGVVGEGSKAVFNGKIIVREGAIKTDSEQRVANLLLSPKAEVNAKPELEIYNDDVKCAHGATFGQLDEDALFYLRARGVDRDAARALLTYSFAREILDHIQHDELRQRVTTRLLEQLPQSALLGGLL